MPDQRTISAIEYRDLSSRLHERATLHDRVVKAQLELTYRCNLHCRHCYTDPYNSRAFLDRELSLEEMKRILDEMAEYGILWLNLTGGEIFTHPHFFDLYEYAYRKGFLLQLYTNGTVFTESLVERLAAAPPFSIDVSCHSVDEEGFDWFTQIPGSFRKFMKGMALLRHSGLPLSFKTKGMSWNKDELPDIKSFVESFDQPFGFTTSLSPRLNGDLSPLELRLAPEDAASLEAAMLAEAVEDPSCVERQPEPPAEAERLFRCGCATRTIHINPWGELGTCTMQYERRASLREYSLAEAVDKVFGDIRALRYTSDSPCKTCDIPAFCNKQPTQARWECGDAEAPIPYDCDVAFARARRLLAQPLIHPLRKLRRPEGDHDEPEKAVRQPSTVSS